MGGRSNQFAYHDESVIFDTFNERWVLYSATAWRLNILIRRQLVPSQKVSAESGQGALPFKMAGSSLWVAILIASLILLIDVTCESAVRVVSRCLP